VDQERAPATDSPSRLVSVVDWLLPPQQSWTAQNMRQARLLLAICCGAVVVEPFFALRHYLSGNPGAAYVTLALATAALVILLLMRRGLSPAVAVQLACGSVVLAGAGVSIARGAFLIPPLMAHVFLPLAGVLLDRRGIALRWAAIGAANLTLLAAAARVGLFGLAPKSAAEFPQLVFFVVCSTILAVAYDHTRRELDRDRVRLQNQLVSTQRLESLGHLAAGVAHDFNNLLCVFRSSAESLLADLPPGHPMRADAEAVQDGVTRGVAITARLLSFARQDQTKNGIFDARNAVAQMRSLLRHALPPGIDLVVEAGAEPTYVRGDRGELDRVLLNLVVNARDAMPEGGLVRVTTHSEGATEEQPGQFVISIADNGKGIPEAVLPHIFEPFFTTKPRGSGTGLGLSSAWSAMKAMGGDIRVETSAAGSRFDLVLPAARHAPAPALEVSAAPPTMQPRVRVRARAPAPARPHAPPAAVEAPSSTPAPPPVPSGIVATPRGTPQGTPRRATIVLVDDQAPVLRATKRLLERDGHVVLDAASGGAALGLLAQDTGKVTLLITDVVMPEMSGVELAARFREQHPGVPIIYVSGHFDEEAVRREVAGGGARLLAKPFTLDALRTTIRDALGDEPLARSG
jgi:signal transduction histidine kinase/ActR/RegA family two-component response regulator